MNPFISFCVYVAARVFVQYLRTRPKDQQMNASLQFLLQALQALRRKNPLTESFLVQLDLDLESAGIPTSQQTPYLPSASRVSQNPRQSERHDWTTIPAFAQTPMEKDYAKSYFFSPSIPSIPTRWDAVLSSKLASHNIRPRP